MQIYPIGFKVSNEATIKQLDSFCNKYEATLEIDNSIILLATVVKLWTNNTKSGLSISGQSTKT
jgi:hypothetical protein